MSNHKTIADLRVGDTVWIGDVNRKGQLQTGKVEKVGRSLLHVAGATYRMDTGYRNDGYSHQWLIPDLAAHEERAQRSQLWRDIRDGYSLHPAVTLADLREAARLLRITP